MLPNRTISGLTLTLNKPRGNEIASRAHEMGIFGTSFRERGCMGRLYRLLSGVGADVTEARVTHWTSVIHYFCNPSNIDGRVYVYVCIWLRLGLGLGLVLGFELGLGFAMICCGHGHLC